MLQEKRSMPAHAVATELRRRIASGEYREGEWLPTERELSAVLGVHRKSVRAAIEELAAEGLIEVKPRCRPVICEGAGRAATPFGPAANGRRRAAASASLLVGLLMATFRFKEGPMAQELIFWGMNRALADAGYHGVFLNIGEGLTQDQTVAREAEHLKYALDNGFAGVIIYAHASDRNRQLLQEVSHRMPVVMIDRLVAGVEADFVGIDNYRAMFEATRHMVDMGHRHIVYVTGGEAIAPVGDRLLGYRAAVGVDVPESILMGTDPSRPWPAFDAIFKLPAGERPTAVQCVNDVEALYAARRLQALGLSVPEDVSLGGFDNIVENLPNGVGLTTVEQPYEQIGETAAHVLLQRLKNPGAPSAHVEISTRMVLRDSVRRVEER